MIKIIMMIMIMMMMMILIIIMIIIIIFINNNNVNHIIIMFITCHAVVERRECPASLVTMRAMVTSLAVLVPFEIE